MAIVTGRRSPRTVGSWAKIGELERISPGGLSTSTVGSCRGGKILGPTRQRVDVPAGMHSLALRARMSFFSAGVIGLLGDADVLARLGDRRPLGDLDLDLSEPADDLLRRVTLLLRHGETPSGVAAIIALGRDSLKGARSCGPGDVRTKSTRWYCGMCLGTKSKNNKYKKSINYNFFLDKAKLGAEIQAVRT